MARDELLIREAYHRGRRFEEPKSGMSQEKKEEALLLIDESAPVSKDKNH
ncbi:MAG: hypothetical protein ACLUUO_15160 [Sellimonas intestinalis]